MGNERCGSAAAASLMTGLRKIRLSCNLKFVIVTTGSGVRSALVIGRALLLLADAADASGNLPTARAQTRGTHRH
jgi:hypothetical protein